jgi:predicted O-methyltransferase YrrM
MRCSKGDSSEGISARNSFKGVALRGMPARLRSLLTLGLSELVSKSTESVAALDARLSKIEDDIASLRSLVRARDDRAQRELKAGFSSLLNMISILPQLKVDGVLPPFPHRGFEITGEEAAFLFQLIRRHRPKLVTELGSGSSTILLAAALRANGSGRLISVEHDDRHARNTAQLLQQAELTGWVQQVKAPLAECSIGNRAFSWYALEPLLRTLSEKIDFLFVDGPPGKIQSLSRYPALPILAPHLSARALVFVDDGGRDDEMEMIKRWRELEDVAFESEELDFLPHSPVLLTFAGESRVAELRVAREEHAAQATAENVEVLGGERRSGVS